MADKPITDPDVIEQIRVNMPLASMDKKGLANIAQSAIDIRIEAGQSVDINLIKYGLYVCTSMQMEEGGNRVRITNLLPSNYQILSINKI